MKKLKLLHLFLFSLLSVRAQVSTLIEREAQYQHYSGMALVINEGRELINSSYGWADFSKRIENNMDIPMDIGSISKQFTAAAILKLVSEDKIDLNETIGLYLPSQFMSKKWEKVTVHHLLTHSSGIPSLFQTGQGIDLVLPNENPVNDEELINIFKNVDLLFKPGNEYKYSNSGYLLLAVIIEEISGQSFGDYMYEEIFQEYGLTCTSFGPTQKYALPHYNYRDDLICEAPLFHKSWMKGAGGIYSTTEDLYKWVSVITSDNFLSPELRSKYLTGHVNKRGGMYGYGWEIVERNGKKILEHSGANFGYMAYLGFDPESMNTVALLTNQSYEGIHLLGNSENYVISIAEKIWEGMEGKQPDILPEITSDTVSCGEWVFSDGYHMEISKKGEVYKVKGTGDYALTRLGYHFELEGDDERIQKLKILADHLKTKKYWGMTSIMDGQMKFAIYSGLFGWGFGQISEGLGKVTDAKAVELGEATGIVRLTGTESILDVIAYFNEEGKIQGVFENGWYEEFTDTEITAYPIGENLLYLDGFPYGETSSTIRIEKDTLYLEQLGRIFRAIPVIK